MYQVEIGRNRNLDPAFLFDLYTHHRPIWHRFGAVQVVHTDERTVLPHNSVTSSPIKAKPHTNVGTRQYIACSKQTRIMGAFLLTDKFYVVWH